MSKLIMYSIPIFVLALISIATIYASRRIAWAFSFSPKIAVILFSVIIFIFLFSMIYIMQTNATGTISNIMNNISNIGLGVLMLFVLSIISVDLLHLVFKLKPLLFGFSTIALTVILSGYSLYNAQNIKVIQQDIQLPNLQQPLKIAQLSDVHIGHFWGEKAINKTINLVKNENVDAVVITGDLFDGRVRLNNDILKPFKQLQVPIFFIEGNHDGYSGSAEIKNLLRENGINVLTNQITEFKGLQIVGLDYLLADNNTANTFHAPLKGTTIQEILPTFKIDKSRASVLLHHNPIGIEYAAENGINLYLAGHTHGGQIFPATIIANLMFKYNKGLYKYNDNTQIYVSQGSGTFGPPMRLGTNSEITILNLH